MLNLLMPFAGSLVSGGASLLGSMMQGQSNARAARLNAMYQATQNQMDRDINQANFAVSNQRADDQFRHQMEVSQNQFDRQMESAAIDRQLQEIFAKNGVQWRVQDAKAAGLHPLAALGAQISSPSPIQVSGSVPGGNVPTASPVSSNPISPFRGNDSIASAMSSFGQDLSRAMTASASAWEREQAVKTASSALSLENQSLQNQLLSSQIAKTSGASVGPPAPIPSSGSGPLVVTLRKSALVKEKPHEPVAGHPSGRQSEPGEVTDTGYARTSTGYAPVPSKDVKERIEDNLVSELMWEARNRLTQSLGFGLNPPKHVPLKQGHEWYFNPLRQEYQQRIPPYDKKTGNWQWKSWYGSKTH